MIKNNKCVRTNVVKKKMKKKEKRIGHPISSNFQHAPLRWNFCKTYSTIQWNQVTIISLNSAMIGYFHIVCNVEIHSINSNSLQTTYATVASSVAMTQDERKKKTQSENEKLSFFNMKKKNNIIFLMNFFVRDANNWLRKIVFNKFVLEAIILFI